MPLKSSGSLLSGSQRTSVKGDSSRRHSAEYSVSGPTGLCVAELVLEGKNTGDLMAQRTLSMRIDGANAFSVTVSPSEGRQTVLRGFTMISGVRKMSFSYSGEEIDLVSVRMLADGKSNGGN